MLLKYLFLMLLLPFFLPKLAADFQLALDGCPDECHGVKIPYPFGIGDGCYLNGTAYGNSYNIKCYESLTPPISFRNIPLLSIDLQDHTFRIAARVAFQCYENNKTTNYWFTNLTIVSFTASASRNMFVAIGCDTIARVKGRRFNEPYYTGCTTYCTSMTNIKNGSCSGVGCCENPIPQGVNRIQSQVGSYYRHRNAPWNPCSAAFVVEKSAFNFSTLNLTAPESKFDGLRLPLVFDWSIIHGRCSDDIANRCGYNTRCVDNNANDTHQGYRCLCSDGYEGNPYLPSGCSDVDECSQHNQCEKIMYCVNTIGSYRCQCPDDFSGNGTTTSPCRAKVFTRQWWKNMDSRVKVTIGTTIGLMMLLLGGLLLYMHHMNKKIIILRESFFKKNGGLILSEKLKGFDLSVQKFKIYTIKELQKATNDYCDSSIIGRGGFGMVYKGTLANGQDVAIKRSLKVNPNQVEQFINEILILSEINNRNVVKLFGCCLEAEIPLLVYEFITNGTLYEHLHDTRRAALLSWDIRLSIAESIASVLSYLHTTIAMPIIHRDMKSMNILLDENYTAKVSDFGASKLVPTDHGELATMVIGTHGYLDPEYLQTSVLTEKSDVYSFGVVMVELLTRMEAVSYGRPEDERSLAMNFLHKLKEGHLFDILDEKIKNNGNLKQLKEVAYLAKHCLHVKGEERPSMKEVARELEAIMRTQNHHPWIPSHYEGQNIGPILNDSQTRSLLLE